MKVLIVLCVFMTLNAVYAANLRDILTSGYAHEERVIKGHEAVPHSAPYIVSLSQTAGGSHICGGTIIAKDWIITAGHCITKTPEGMGVVAGLHTRNVLDEDTQVRVVDFGKVHELFGGGVGPYDIAILHVNQPFEFNAAVQAASLPARKQIPAGDATLYGWGQTKALILTAAKTLQTVNTQIVEWNECKALMPENSKLTDTNICSDSQNAGISACNGDSGGPLVQETESTPSELIGVVSWGFFPCGMANMPSVYTRVSAYVDWIVQVMNAYYVLN